MKQVYFLMMAITALTFNAVNGQRSCGSFELYKKQLAANPSFAANQQLLERMTASFINNGGSNSMARAAGDAPVYTIPVVVHVVWNKAVQNISDEQILSQLDVLNKDFQLLNADTIKTPAPFKPLRADVKIQFCLAQRDPNGFPTTGIVRKQTSTTSFNDNDNVKFATRGGSNAWPANQYLNIWVCNTTGGLLGYAQFPGGPANTDGVVILYTAFGTTGAVEEPFHLGRTTTHEVGHWLNLYHIWGDDGDECFGSDLISDTPNQADENYGCPTFPAVSCNNGPNGDMFMNYMDYTDDECMNMFSLKQRDRMHAVFQTGAPRAAIVSSKGCKSAMADLSLTNFQVTPTTVSSGNNVTVKFEVNNTGGVAAAPHYVHFYVSADNVLTPGANGDTLVDQYYLADSLAAKTKTTLISKDLTIPLSRPAGNYYIFFVSDATEMVAEDSETNNKASVPITVTTAPNLPDLVVKDAAASKDTITTGAPITINFRNKNQGLTNAAASVTSTWLSRDQKFDSADINLNNNVAVPALAKDETSGLFSQQLTIADSIPGGKWHLMLRADAAGTVDELNEANNPVFIPLTIYSNLPCTPPASPTLTFGSNSCSAGSSPPAGTTLTWNKVPEATGYLISISKYPYSSSDTIAVPVFSSCFSDTSLSIASTLQPGMLYTFKVRATKDCYNLNCTGVSSNANYFSIPPVITANSGNTICQGGSTILSTALVQPASGITVNYKWLKNGALFQQGNSLASVQVSSPGSYSLIIEYTGSANCTGTVATNASAPVIITINNISNWLGSVDGSWHNPLNWSCGIVPTENTKVVIKAGTAFNCAIDSPAVCSSLTVLPGAVLTANNKLDIKH